MMLEISCDSPKAADSVRKAVEKVLDEGFRTGDIAMKGEKTISCAQMGDCVVRRLEEME